MGVLKSFKGRELLIMATRSVVGYKNEQGQFRGTYVHWDGYPSHMLPSLSERLRLEGYKVLTEWIEQGIAGGGYSSVDYNEPYNDVYEPWNLPVDNQEYGYLVQPDKVALVFSKWYEPVPEIEKPETELIDWR